jgi:hypothetical protein
MQTPFCDAAVASDNDLSLKVILPVISDTIEEKFQDRFVAAPSEHKANRGLGIVICG